eukprot:766815-Hanusia_phi.AAC.1
MQRLGKDDHAETQRLLERLNLVSEFISPFPSLCGSLIPQPGGGNAARGGGWIENDAYKHDGARVGELNGCNCTCLAARRLLTAGSTGYVSRRFRHIDFVEDS